MVEVVSREQALGAGRTPQEVDALVRSGRWLPLRRGVYLTGPTLPEDPRVREAVRVRAAVLAAGVPSVGSHESAALVHGLPLFTAYDGPPLLTRTRPPGTPRSNPRPAARLVAQVEPRDQTVVLDAPVTTLARTAVDLARTRLPLTAVVALDAALRAGCSRAELLEVADRQPRWPGSAVARRRIAFADGRAESPLESIGRWRMHELELPAPEPQVTLGSLDRPLGRVDFYFRAQRTVVEADGAVKYARRDDEPEETTSLFQEKLREDALRDAGFEVVRFSWEIAVHRPEVLLQRILAAFARSAARSRP